MFPLGEPGFQSLCADNSYHLDVVVVVVVVVVAVFGIFRLGCAYLKHEYSSMKTMRNAYEKRLKCV